MFKRLSFVFLSASVGLSYGGQLLGYRTLNSEGSVLQLGNGIGQTVSRSYHTDGSLKQSIDLSDYALSPSYSVTGQLSSTTIEPNSSKTLLEQLLKSGPVSPAVSYSYDPVTHRLLSAESLSPGTLSAPGFKVSYTYNPDGSLSDVVYKYLESGSSTSLLTSVKEYHVHYIRNTYGDVEAKESWFGSGVSVPSIGVSKWYHLRDSLGRISKY